MTAAAFRKSADDAFGEGASRRSDAPPDSLERQNDLLRKVLAASQVLGDAVSSEMEIEPLCDVIVAQFVEIFSPHTLVLLFCDEDHGDLYVKRRAGPGAATDTRQRVVMGQGAAGTAFAQQRLVFLQQGDPRLLQPPQVQPFQNPQSLVAVPLTAGAAPRSDSAVPMATAAVPLKAERRVKGVLALSWKGQEVRGRDEDLHALEALGAQAATAIDNAWLYGQLNQLNAGLERKVQERTAELRQSNVRLDEALVELKQAQAQMVQAEKMASLGQLTAGIAHEINNPLAFVINNVALVREQLEAAGRKLELARACELAAAQTTEEARRDTLLAYVRALEAQPRYRDDVAAFLEELAALHDVAAELQLTETFVAYVRATELQMQAGDASGDDGRGRMGRLLDRALDGLARVKDIVLDLRSFARLDEAQFQNAVLDVGIASTLSIVEHLARERQVTLCHRPGCPAPYPCFPAKLNQVVLNLVTNAVQATPPGGRVVVATRESPAGPSIEVQDTGTGIPEDVRAKIFDPFFTTKPVGHGTGLGLSISYKIIEEHGGRIDVDSRIGEGTRFLVQLPPRHEP